MQTIPVHAVIRTQPRPGGYKKRAVPAAERRKLAQRYGAFWGRPLVAARCEWCPRIGGVIFTSPSFPAFVDLEMDHVIPEFLGGPNIAANLVLACPTCNRGKRDKIWGSDDGGPDDAA